MKAQPAVFHRAFVGALSGLLIAMMAWHFGFFQQGASERRASPDGKNLPGSSPQRTARVPPDPSGTKTALSSFLSDFSASLRSLRRMTNGIEWDKTLASLSAEIPLAEISNALAYLNQQPASETSRQLKQRLVRRWAVEDVFAAAQWAAQQTAEGGRQDSIDAVATVWAGQDLAAAMDWVRQLGEGDRDSAMLAVAYEAARTDPRRAFELAMEMPANGSRDDLITHTTAQWASTDPEESAKWAAKIEDKVLRDRVLVEVAVTWGETNPIAAATMAMKSLHPGRQQDDAVMGIVQRWAQTQPAEAAQWISHFSEGALRDTALEELVKLWADRNLVEAGDWVNTLEASPSRDIAVSAYVSKIASAFPELAADWAVDIADPILRDRELERVGEIWMTSDAAAARAWISQATLPVETKSRWLALKPR